MRVGYACKCNGMNRLGFIFGLGLDIRFRWCFLGFLAKISLAPWIFVIVPARVRRRLAGVRVFAPGCSPVPGSSVLAENVENVDS
jgi:hypothetical protein